MKNKLASVRIIFLIGFMVFSICALTIMMAEGQEPPYGKEKGVWILIDKKPDVEVREDNDDYNFNKYVSLSGTAIQGGRSWKDGPNPEDCHGSTWGLSSWTELPVVLEPGDEQETTLMADSGGEQTCSARWAGAFVWFYVNDVKAGEIDHSQHPSDPVKGAMTKTVSWEVPWGNIGDTLTIVVAGGDSSYSRKANVIYTYSYQAKASDVTPYSFDNEVPQTWGQKPEGAGYYEFKPPSGADAIAFLKTVIGKGLVWIDGLPVKLPIEPGKVIPIAEGSRVITGFGTEVVVKFRTGAFTILKENSDFVVEPERHAKADTGVIYTRLINGIGYFYIPKHAAAEKKFEVETNMAIVGIRQTIFNVEHDSDRTIVEVAEGAVAVKSKATGDEVIVNTGEKIVVTAAGLSKKESFDTKPIISEWKEIAPEVDMGERMKEIESPNDIEGLKLWLDGSDLNGDGINPADGSLVGQWTDKSGLGHHAINPDSSTQPTYVANAVNNRGGVDFGLKDNDFLETAATTDFSFDSASIFIVANHGESAAHMDIATPGCWDDEFLIYDQGVYHHSSTSNYRAVGFPDPPSGFYIQLGQFGKSAIDLENMINGEVSTTTIAADGTPLDYTSVSRAATIGWRQGHLLPAENFDGTICEVIVYDHKLNPSEQNSIVAWLEEKYGIDAGAAANR